MAFSSQCHIVAWSDTLCLSGRFFAAVVRFDEGIGARTFYVLEQFCGIQFKTIQTQ